MQIIFSLTFQNTLCFGSCAFLPFFPQSNQMKRAQHVIKLPYTKVLLFTKFCFQEKTIKNTCLNLSIRRGFLVSRIIETLIH